MNNKMKIKIQKKKEKKTWRRRRTRARDGTWRGMGVRGNDGSRNNSSQTAATRRKKKRTKHGPLSFARPSSRCLPKIFSFTSLFFPFHRLLLAHRGKRNGFCHYIDIMTIYTSIRKWGGAIHIYLPTALRFFFYSSYSFSFIYLFGREFIHSALPSLLSLFLSLLFAIFKKWLVQRVYRPVRVMSAKSTSDRA